MIEKTKCMKDCEDNDIRQDDSFFYEKKPLKFWEVDQLFKCPVIGMCLTLTEQKQILKKSDISVKKKSLFEIHEKLLANSDSKNQVSRRVDNLLNRKFGKEAAPLLDLDHEKFMAHCRNAFVCKDCMGVLWAVAARPNLPPECKRELFGEIHMIMHWNGEQSMKLKRELARQQKQVDSMSQRVKESICARRSLQKKNKTLKQDQEYLKAKMEDLLRKKSGPQGKIAGRDSQRLNDDFENKIEKLEGKFSELTANFKNSQLKIISLKEKNAQISFELERQRKLVGHFRKNTQREVEKFITQHRCDASCPSFDLCKKRILIIGGMERMESLYRKLIESKGGVFEYHDGCMKNGVKGLEYRLRRADVVLCPVSCNSHAACSAVKNLAKKYNKTVHMLANFSLNAVSQVILDADNRGYSVN